MKDLRSEGEITANWKGNIDEPVVSVCCITYNHEPYIEDALEGFLIQETDFPFEILIHDDASTDKTADIIRAYQAKYPKLIKPILQTENQRSKGGFRPTAYTAKFAVGNYIALCDGDDYWIDSNKLQSQISEFQKYPNINLCVHDALIINQDGNKHESYGFPIRPSVNYIIDYKEIYTTVGQFSPTASMLIKKEVFDTLPDFFFNVPVGDFFLEALSGLNGIIYLPSKMSVYRRGSLNSWTEKTADDIKKSNDHSLRMIKSLNSLKEFINPEYKGYIECRKEMISKRQIKNNFKKHHYSDVFVFIFVFLKSKILNIFS